MCVRVVQVAPNARQCSKAASEITNLAGGVRFSGWVPFKGHMVLVRIVYTDNVIKIKKFPSVEAASWFCYTEGDHVVSWKVISKC